MQKDSGNHRANAAEDLARNLAISEQRSNWKWKQTKWKNICNEAPKNINKFRVRKLHWLNQHKTICISSQNSICYKMTKKESMV